MKKIISVILLLMFNVAVIAQAGPEMEMKPIQGSAELEMMKGLAGTWTGTHAMDEKAEPVTVTYEVTSNGSVVLERLCPGTPMEMVTIYHDRGGKLSVTHYCAIGNQPRMDLTSREGNTLTFDFSDTGEINPATDLHMHSLKLSLVDEKHLTHDWTSYQNGKPADTAHFEFMRNEL